jgi:hypothetical protein
MENKIAFLPNQNKNLHPMIYFIADKPTKENISLRVPLVGTKSYGVLLSWCAKMNIDVSRVRFFNQSDDPFQGLSGYSLQQAVKLGQIKVIVLGKEALKYILKCSIEEFFVLPHPSPKNRKLNDKKKLELQLANCKDFVYGKTFEAKAPTQPTAEQSSEGQKEV